MRLRFPGREEGVGINPSLSPSAPSGSMLREPEIEDDLIEYLSKAFPDALPEPHTDLRTIDFRIGQQAIIKHLRALNKRQKDPSEA